MRMSNMIRSNMLVLGTVFATLGAPTVWADGGGEESMSTMDAAACSIQVGTHVVRFIAYQGELTGATGFCRDIPQPGKATVAFDYEGNALRNMTVEFEITKDPQGTRIFYQPPSTHPTGTFNSDVDFAEGGDYVVHVTLVNEGQKIDSHIPFSVGAHTGTSSIIYLIVAAMLTAGGYVLYLSNAAFQGMIDRALKKKTA